MGYLTSGNEIVDAMASINISGSVIPAIWYQTIRKENGRPYLLAIAILADIVYWYRPSEVRDEKSGQILGWKKKFADDILQKNYQNYADYFGESKRTVKSAMDYLEEIGVITKEFRTITYNNGMVSNNVMYVRLNPMVLYHLTYPEEGYFDDDNQTNESGEMQEHTDSLSPITENCIGVVQNNVSPVTENCRRVVQNSVPPVTENCRRVVQNNVPPVEKDCKSVVQNNVTAPTKFCRTNTKNTAEITTENHPSYRINPSGQSGVQNGVMDGMDTMKRDKITVSQVEVYRHYLWQQLECDIYANENEPDYELYRELYENICEVVCFPRDSIMISGEPKPYEIVKSRFMKLDSMQLKYVIERVSKYTGKIGNIKKYLIAALYNAPMTSEFFTTQKVASDMAEGKI